MNKKLTLLLRGTITAEQPLTTTPPHVKSRDKEPKHLPTMSMLINGMRDAYPYFPAPGIKGKLRRAAVAHIRENLIERTGNEKPFGRNQHYLLTTGGNLSKGQQDASARDPMRDQKIRAQNPLLSLFGAGNPFVSGRISIGHALPFEPIKVDVIGGVRTDDLVRNPENLDYLSVESIDGFYQTTLLNAEKSKLKAALSKTKIRSKMTDEEKSAVIDKQKQLSSEIEAIENELTDIGSSTVSNQLPLDGYEVMPIGTQLAHQISIRNGTVDEIGLFLHALENYARDPIIGGHIANGCGEISMDYTVYLKDTPLSAFKEIGKISLNKMIGLSIECESGFLQNAAVSFETSFDDFDFSEIEIVKPKNAKGKADDSESQKAV